MTVRHMIRNTCMALAAVAAITFFAGCESGGGGGGGGSSGGSVVGRWAMTGGGGSSYWAFNSDGTFTMYNDAEFTSAHLGGTFSQDGAQVTGSFRNGSVGDGEIEATVSDDGKSIELDFIEHWHSPYKHVPMSGTKL